MSNHIDWPEIIFSILCKKKWKQYQLACHLGVADSTLGGWLKYGHEPRYSKGAELLKLANDNVPNS